MASNYPVTPDTMITVKVLFDGETRRFRIALRDMSANTLPAKLRGLLAVPTDKNVVFERYSDSNARYVVLDASDTAVWKQLWRAAKAKLKLRLRVVAVPAPEVQEVNEPTPSVPSYPQLSIDRFDGTNSTKAAPTGSMAPPPAPPKREHHDVIKSIIAAQNMYRLHNMSDATLRPEPVSKTLDSFVTKKEPEEEAPVPRAFVDRTYAQQPKSKPTVLRGCDQTFRAPLASFTVQCNNCDENILSAHWHCSICEEGDFDLCPRCVDCGEHCQVDSHFLIKRSIEGGRVVNSSVETAPRKSVKIEEPEKEIPGAFTTETKQEDSFPELSEMTRTCNCCVNSFDESSFVTCLVCEDYDLCIECHLGVKHGHNPSHAFAPVAEAFALDTKVSELCAPGRNMRHFASCDGCDKTIHGVRHKCMNCPDFDFCSTCFASAVHIHQGHRFVPVYETLPIPNPPTATHYSIRCDGPLCKYKMNFIRGDRYKCAVCDGIDFCANCEALPSNPHNRTHPLIKFRTPVRNVSVTTYGEHENGEAMVTLGDRIPTRSRSTETTPAAPSANAATQVQTVVEVKPSEPVKKAEKVVVKEEPKIVEEPKAIKTEPPPQLEAHFVSDSIPDGTVLAPGAKVTQTWMVRNPGPAVWPAGCSVRFIGGDHMLNIDGSRPSSITELDQAIQSNTIALPVLPGVEVYFTVTIKAPQREGKAISYWRIKTASGLPFGHKLWCDINVRNPAEAEAPAIASSEVEEKPVVPVKEEAKEVDAEAKKVSESQMVFPTLDKESPVSSAHEAAPAATTSETAPSTAPSTAAAEELEEELENLDISDDETDECLLTDEEYDIIDDAEEEAVNGKK